MKFIKNKLRLLEEEKRAFSLLSAKEKLQRNREARLLSLVNVGYLSPDEAETYRELHEIPTDRKGLAVSYFLMGIEDFLGLQPDLAGALSIRDILRDFRASYPTASAITETEAEKWAVELARCQILQGVKRAESFVDAKISRLRDFLRGLMPVAIASALSKPHREKKATPFLNAFLRKRGYSSERESLSDQDKKAIREAGDYYFNLLELLFLNGETIIRIEEYKETPPSLYLDVEDEALLEFEIVAKLLDNAVSLSYGEGTAKEAIDFLKDVRDHALKSYYSPLLQGTKFECLLAETGIDNKVIK